MSNENNTNNVLDIGFLEKKESWQLHPRFFPSKVGGKPAWLDLENLPNPKDLLCKLCEEPLIFLCQVYAPYEESDDCFHRTLFIFICKNGSCCKSNATNNMLVLRCQMPRKNRYFSFEPYREDKDEEFPLEQWTKMCNVCGAKGTAHCSKCKKSYYCSRKHQILDWQKGHKQECESLKDVDYKINNWMVSKSGKSILFDEWEIIIDHEDDEETPTNVDIEREMQKMNTLIKEKKIGTLNGVSENELEQYTEKTVKDKVFNNFSKRVAKHPAQVLRYERGGTPLWITDPGIKLQQIPKCQHCESERQFEFQIMPQLLNFLSIGAEVNSIDWGILGIYTCKNSCNTGPSYKGEYIIKQDITA